MARGGSLSCGRAGRSTAVVRAPSTDGQVRQQTKAGYKKVFREVASGATTGRAELRKAIAKLDAATCLRWPVLQVRSE
jgi:hypothetical protein